MSARDDVEQCGKERRPANREQVGYVILFAHPFCSSTQSPPPRSLVSVHASAHIFVSIPSFVVLLSCLVPPSVFCTSRPIRMISCVTFSSWKYAAAVAFATDALGPPWQTADARRIMMNKIIVACGRAGPDHYLLVGVLPESMIGWSRPYFVRVCSTLFFVVQSNGYLPGHCLWFKDCLDVTKTYYPVLLLTTCMLLHTMT